MYRQHLRMVLLNELESKKSRSELVHRIASIPVVYLAWNIAADTYHSVKSSNRLLNISLTTTERAAYFVTKPVLQRFEKQLKSADLIACRGIQALQDLVPSILQRQKRIFEHTKELYNETIESGLRKFEFVKQLSTMKVTEIVDQGNEKLAEFQASPYGEICDLALDFTLDAGEIYVDHFLPPLGDERADKLFGDRAKEPSLQRVEMLRSRIKERLYKHSLLKIQMVRLRTKQLIIKIYNIDVHKYIVDVSASMPGLILTSVTQMFFSLQDVITYLSALLALKQRDTSPV